jgi:pimeloyl-ACP methyl ester carboxylesterase
MIAGSVTALGASCRLPTIVGLVSRDVVAFKVHVPEESLKDMSRRLMETRIEDPPSAGSWFAGLPIEYLRRLIDYWLNDFDWRKVEDRLDKQRHMRFDARGMRIHFVHQSGRGSESLPLVLVHGWPSSFLELLDLADLLSDPAGQGGAGDDAFDVVIPSLPGFGFSDKRWLGPWAPVAGKAIHELMMSLGYERYGVHTHDVGASVMTGICLSNPKSIIGYHTTEPGIPGPYPEPDLDSSTAEEREYQSTVDAWLTEEGGYFALLRSRPLTIGHALHDSPVGLAAWIAEKWWSWTVPPGSGRDLSDFVSMDLLVANIALYWLTGTIQSANWIYTPGQRRTRQVGERTFRPVGVTLGAQSIERAPRTWAERFFGDIRYWADLRTGGHFIAAEEPRLLAESIREFFRPLRETVHLGRIDR